MILYFHTCAVKRASWSKSTGCSEGGAGAGDSCCLRCNNLGVPFLWTKLSLRTWWVDRLLNADWKLKCRFDLILTVTIIFEIVSNLYNESTSVPARECTFVFTIDKNSFDFIMIIERKWARWLCYLFSQGGERKIISIISHNIFFFLKSDDYQISHLPLCQFFGNDFFWCFILVALTLQLLYCW